MPPLKGIDRGLNGEALKALEEAGHGQVIAIVDPSYAIPEHARVINYQGESSASALQGILSLVPTEKIRDMYDAVIMAADEEGVISEAEKAFHSIAAEMGLSFGVQKRLDQDSPLAESRAGFYTDTNVMETLFIRTRDTKAYACARFVVGHSQE